MKYGSVAQLFIRWAVCALGVLIASSVIPGISYENGSDLIVVVLLLSFLNAVLRPILVLFALPFVILTMGIGILVINALLFMLVAHWVDGFHVASFLSAFFGSLIVSLTSLFLLGSRRIQVHGPRRNPPGRRKDDDVIDI
ncbi:MAG: phage holin family protein [Opitutaceae bacterium]